MATQLNNVYLRSGGKLALALGTDPTRVYGSIEADVVTIAAGVTVVLDGSFGRGNDTIRFTGNAASYSVVRVNASTVRITDAAGTSVTIPVGSAGTAIEFADATRTLSGSSAGILLGNQTITATPVVLAAGTAPAPVEEYILTSSAPTVTEGNTGTKTLTYLLTLNKAPTSEVTVNYQTIDTGTDAGAAAAGDDFQVVAGVATFAPGQTATTVSVTVFADTIVEADETVVLHLSGSKLVAAVDALGTIRNDDSAPVDPSAYNVTAGDIAAANASDVPVTLNIGSTGSKTVTIQSDGASATQGIIINGDANATVNSGAAGDKIIMSGNGNNTINTGGGNNDVTVYGSGANTINVGTGDDKVVSGSGNDRIILAAGSLNENDNIDGGAGYDVVQISGDGNIADFGDGGNLVDVEELVLVGTTLKITSLDDALAAGLVKITGSPSSSVITVLAADNDVIDLSGLNLSGIKEIKLDADGGNVTIKLSAEQISQIGAITEQGAIVGGSEATNLTIDTSVAGYNALRNKAPNADVTITDTVDNLIKAGNSISGVEAKLGDASVAQAQEALASGLTVSYALVDSPANLALAPVSVFESATAVTVSGTATAAQASAIQASIVAASNEALDEASLTLNVADSASNIANYLDDTIDADSITSLVGEPLTVAQASALYLENLNATFRIQDTPEELSLADVDLLEAADSVTVAGNEALTVEQALGIPNLQAGYTLSGGFSELSAKAALIGAAGNVTIEGPVSVLEALTIRNFTNTGAKNYELEDTIGSLLAASSWVRTTAASVSVTSETISQAQLSSLIQAFGAARVNEDSVVVSDTVSNLLKLTTTQVGEASEILISAGSTATAQQAIDLKALTGEKMPQFTVRSSAAELEAAFAQEANLALLDTATAINVSGTVKIAQLTAFNEALEGNPDGLDAVGTYAISDTVAAVAAAADPDDESISGLVANATAVTVTGSATVDQIASINSITKTAADLAGYALRDGVEALRDANAMILDRAASVTVNGQASLEDIQDIKTKFNATPPAAVLGTSLVYSITDGYLAFDDPATDELAILNGATQATLLDSKSNIFTKLSPTERAVAGFVTVSDNLENMSFTTAQLSEIDLLDITDTNLTVDDATDVNAAAVLKTTTYSIVDSFQRLTNTSSEELSPSEKAAIATMVRKATNVDVMDEAISVAQFNTLDGLTDATSIAAAITGTVEELSASDAAKAIESALDAEKSVSIEDSQATVSQAEILSGRGVSINGLDVVDSAAAIERASEDVITEARSFVVSDNGLVTGSVDLVTKVYSQDGSSYGNYAIVDTAEHILAASEADAGLINFAQSVIVDGDVDMEDAAALATLQAMGPVVYSIKDSAGAIAAEGGDAARNNAVDVTVDGFATVAQAVVINGVANTGAKTYAIEDSADKFVGADDEAQLDIANAVNAATTVEVTASVTVPEQWEIIAGFTKKVTFSIAGSASDIFEASAAVRNEAVNINVTGVAEVAQANAIMAARNSGDTVIHEVSGSAHDVLGLVLGGNDTITQVTVNGTVSLADALLIVAKDTGDNIAGISFETISGSYSELKANPSVAALAGTVRVLGSLTVEQAAELSDVIDEVVLEYVIRDSFSNIMEDTDPGDGIDNAALFSGHSIIVEDTALTVAQAEALVAATDGEAFAYTLRDNDAALVDAIENNSTAILNATSVISAKGDVLSIEPFGAAFAIVGTVAQLDALSSVLQAAQKIYEVSVAELEANADFFVQLDNTQNYRVMDKVENLISGNALLPGAVALVAEDAANVDEALALLAVGPVAVEYSLEIDAAAFDSETVSDIEAAVAGANSVVVVGSINFAEAEVIATNATEGAVLVYDIVGSGSSLNDIALIDDVDVVLNSARNIEVTDELTYVDAQRVLDAANDGRTVIALVTGSPADLDSLELSANEEITAATPGEALTLEQLVAFTAKFGSITSYDLLLTPEELDRATAVQLAGAGDIVVDGPIGVVLAEKLVTAGNEGRTTFDIADTADAILAADPAVLGADGGPDGTASVVVTDETVSASQATRLRKLVVDNTDADDRPLFTVLQQADVGYRPEDNYAISDLAANLLLTANRNAVRASTSLVVEGEVSIADAIAVRTAVDVSGGRAEVLTYDVVDTYSRLVASANLPVTRGADSVRISDFVTVSRANSAVANFQAGTLIMDVRDTASAIANGLDGNGEVAPGLTAAHTIRLSNAATVDQAAIIAESGKLVGGYDIADYAQFLFEAINAPNDVGIPDRNLVLGAGKITLLGFASVEEALGNRASETRGLYTIPDFTFSIKDTAGAIIRGLDSSDYLGIENAVAVWLDSQDGVTVQQAEKLVLLDKFVGYDGNGSYAVSDAFGVIQDADLELIQNAALVTANGDDEGDTIDMSGFSRGVVINALAGDDGLFGTDFADQLVGGAGSDDLEGGTGRDIFRIEASSSTSESAVNGFDKITDFTLASASWEGSSANDTVAEFQALTVGGADADILDINVDRALLSVASGDGIASGKLTVGDVDLAAASILADEAATGPGKTLFFELGSNTYVFTQNGDRDILVELTGVTDVTGLSLLSSSADPVGGAGYIIIG